MTAKPKRARGAKLAQWVACLLVVFSFLGETTARGQNPQLHNGALGVSASQPAEPRTLPSSSELLEGSASVGRDDNGQPGGVVQAGCSSCGAGLLGLHTDNPDMPPPMGECSCSMSPCYPGRPQCHPCVSDNCVLQCLCEVYDCICCPDPCYDPHWIPVADTAFWTETARPQTTQGLRWESGLNMIDPDRSEYFWARADGMGKGPKPVAPFKGEVSLNYNELVLHTETARGNAGIIFDMPYLSVHPEDDPRAAGFGDMTLGTRTLLFDCELLQIAMIFKTYLPVGNVLKGLGTGHISLEPGGILGLKLAEETYAQVAVQEWIPLGGDPNYSGAILHSHWALNQVLYRPLPDVPIVSSLELNTYSFQHGAYTDPILGSFQKSSGETYVYPAVGIRLFVCDKIDFGFDAAFAVTTRHFADQIYRTEVRWRY